MKTVAQLKDDMNQLAERRDDLTRHAQECQQQLETVNNAITSINTTLERCTQLITHLENNPEETAP